MLRGASAPALDDVGQLVGEDRLRGRPPVEGRGADRDALAGGERLDPAPDAGREVVNLRECLRERSQGSSLRAG